MAQEAFGLRISPGQSPATAHSTRPIESHPGATGAKNQGDPRVVWQGFSAQLPWLRGLIMPYPQCIKCKTWQNPRLQKLFALVHKMWICAKCQVLQLMGRKKNPRRSFVDWSLLAILRLHLNSLCRLRNVIAERYGTHVCRKLVPCLALNDLEETPKHSTLDIQLWENKVNES